MRGWKLWLVFLAAVGVLAAAQPPVRAGKAAAKPPNILLIISDDQAWTDYGFMGHPQIRTPNLDRLAARSLAFPRGYVPSSLCCPSLASIITGQYPHRHRVTSNDPPLPAGKTGAQANADPGYQARRREMIGFIDQVPTLPRLLAARGYLSFQTGKWWQGDFRHGGFTHGMTHGDPSRSGRHGDEGLKIGRETLQPAYDFMAEAKKADKPFFLWYAPMLPHQPHNPPERLLNKYLDQAPSPLVARYWAMCEWFDETCGQLLDHLEQQGLANDTVVVYVADNGWIQDPDRNQYAPRSKQSQYEGGLRTPLLVSWPGKIRPKQVEQPVLSLDIAPTLLRLAGLKPPAELPGLDLRDEKAVRARKAIYGECFTHNAVDIRNPASSLRWRWMLQDGWKLIVPAPQNEPAGKVELFQVSRDPNEETDLAAKEEGRVREMRRKLDAWWAGKP